jgi:hypothetical protein
MQTDVEKFQKIAHFLAALAHGAENNLGHGTNSMCTLAGKKFGKEAVQHSSETSEPLKALEELSRALAGSGLFWEIEPFPNEDGEVVKQEGKEKRMRLVFRTCMVRNALFLYAHDQKQSLCYMAHGVFAGAMEKIMPGTSVKLEIIQACPNACLKEMIWGEKA